MIRLDLSWRPERLALIAGFIEKYDVGVKEEQEDLADRRLVGFTKIGRGRIYSVDGFLVTVDPDEPPSVFYQAPKGMPSSECDMLVDSLFEEIDAILGLTCPL